MRIFILLSGLVLSACSELNVPNSGDNYQEDLSRIQKITADLPESQLMNTQPTNWAGLYQAVLPCGSGCSGVAVSLNLSQDMSYTMRVRNLDKEKSDKKTEGQFQWVANKRNIIQITQPDRSLLFRFHDNYLEMLNNEELTLGSAFYLKRVNDVQ